MRVSELIEILKEFPENAEVVTDENADINIYVKGKLVAFIDGYSDKLIKLGE